MNPSDATQSGATAVITHRVRQGKEADYDQWLNEIGPRRTGRSTGAVR